MAGLQPQATVKRLTNLSLVLFCVLFLVFVTDVLLDKAHAVFGWNISIGLGDVGEYLALLSAAFFFIVAALLREHQNGGKNSPSGPDRIANQP